MAKAVAAGSLLALAASTEALSDAQKRAACCVLHDTCQYLQDDEPDLPAACLAGYTFSAEGAEFKIEKAEFPDNDDNMWTLSSGGEKLECECFDYGEWLVHDPLDYKKTLTCPGKVEKLSDEQKRGACCVLHDTCQYLQGDKDIPADCKAGYSFSVKGAEFKIETTSFPSPDDNMWTLSSGGEKLECECFDYGGWFVHDPLDYSKTLTCPGPSVSSKVEKLSDEQKRGACCALHDTCQYLQGDKDIPADCKAGYSFSVKGADFKIETTSFPSPDDNMWTLSSGGEKLECECFDHGGWYVHDPLDYSKTLTCPGPSVPSKVEKLSVEQMRGACCVLHDTCQYLQDGEKDLPAACLAGYSFSVKGAEFKIETAEFPSTDDNMWTLSSGGEKLECECFDYGGWFVHDPVDFKKTLTCPSNSLIV